MDVIARRNALSLVSLNQFYASARAAITDPVTT
jgi:hypothetical protein